MTAVLKNIDTGKLIHAEFALRALADSFFCAIFR